MRMKFKEGTTVEITVEKDFPICSRISGGNILSPIALGYQFGIEEGKHVGIIQESTHGSFQGYYTVKIKVAGGFYAILDVPERLCARIKKHPLY